MGGRIVAQRFEEMKKGQAERLFPLLEEVLGDVGAVWEELDAIGVGTGPGNFTGIRISVSAARGLALALGVPAIGVSGFEAMPGVELLSTRHQMISSIPSSRRDSDVVLHLVRDGILVGEPVELNADGATPDEWKKTDHLPRNVLVCGERAELLDVVFNERYGFEENYYAKADTTPERAHSIAEVAAWRWKRSDHHVSPSPLYIRPPDAAPSSDPPPVILP